jgi:hypothetical protein
LINQIFEAVYTAMKFPWRETLKPKVSGSAEDDAVLDVSSRTVRSGCACVDEVAEGCEGTARSSSLIVEVRAVDWAEAKEESVSPADDADR